MIKAISCQACNGHGFVSIFSHDDDGACNGVSSHTCDACNGEGVVYVDASEFDKVKSMTLDQMAVYLYQIAHQSDKPLNVNEMKLHLKGKAQDSKMSFCRRKERCENCRSYLGYEHMPDYKGIDFQKVEGADGECFVRYQMNQDHQYAGVKADDLCPKWKKRELQEGEEVG